MDGVRRIWGGSFHDYWFTDDAILKVRLVSQAITLIGIVVLFVLAFLYGVIFGLVLGVILSALLYVVGGQLAKRRHPQIAGLSVQDVQQKGLVTLRVPYSVISRAELKGNRLTVFVEGRRIRIKIPQDDLQVVQSLLRSKLPDTFSVS